MEANSSLPSPAGQIDTAADGTVEELALVTTPLLLPVGTTEPEPDGDVTPDVGTLLAEPVAEVDTPADPDDTGGLTLPEPDEIELGPTLPEPDGIELGVTLPEPDGTPELGVTLPEIVGPTDGVEEPGGITTLLLEPGITGVLVPTPEDDPGTDSLPLEIGGETDGVLDPEGALVGGVTVPIGIEESE
ncbi:hypothetical protein HII31_04654 [Pseudocercospora fuligena]|uniref:Uncharacterized protein n=1 Tax=Pseudocercospora fuligena TaxID=685502 RepID=A0A8H6RNM3_9PEZI|nr:hypothetical protein HII31_04654 [Pseudocercospora fuligena]